jgi:hypothetical protein
MEFHLGKTLLKNQNKLKATNKSLQLVAKYQCGLNNRKTNNNFKKTRRKIIIKSMRNRHT